MNENRHERSFITPLTREEVEQSAADMVKLMHEKQGVEDELETARKDAKSRIAALDAGIASHATRVRMRMDFKVFECVDRLSEDGLTVETVDVHTGEIKRERPAEPNERQLALKIAKAEPA